jgi:hypothetical protein
MELELSSTAWRSRGEIDVVDVTSSNTRDGMKLVLVTTKDEIIEYCTQSKKNINHWTFRAGSTNALSVGAVRHPLTSIYYGIRGGSNSSSINKKKQNIGTIVTWKSAELDVTKWKSAGLGSKSKAFGLYTHPYLSEECLVVFEDGSFAVFDEDLQKIYQNTQTPSHHQVFWATLVSDHRNPLKGNVYLSMIFEQQQEQNTIYQLVIYQIVRTCSKKIKGGRAVDSKRLVQWTLTTPLTTHSTDPTIKLTSCAFHADILSYSLAWSNGDWEMISFSYHTKLTKQQLQEEEKEDFELKVISQKKIGSFLSSTEQQQQQAHKKRKLICTTSSSSSNPSTFLVGGVGCFNYLVVAKKDDTTTSIKMSGWDAKFGVQVATCDIETSSPIKNNSHIKNKNGKLIKFVSALNGEHVICMYERAVLIVNVRNKHSTLASVLGCSNNLIQNNTRSIFEEPVLQQIPKNLYHVHGSTQEVDVSQWKKQVLGLNPNDHHYQDLLSSNEKEFVKKFDTFWKKINPQSVSSSIILALTKKCLSFIQLNTTSTTNTTNTTNETWQVLDQLIDTKTLSSRAVPGLLQVLIQENQMDLLDKCIEKMTDIEEKMIVRLLKFYIRQACKENTTITTTTTTTTTKATKKTTKKTNKMTPPRRKTTKLQNQILEKQIVKLLCLPTNNVFLHHAIHQFQLEEVLLVLSICKKYLLTHEKQQQMTKNDDLSMMQQLPSFYEWLCVLLDGYFTQLVLLANQQPKIATFLSHLETFVTKQLNSFEQFEKVHCVLGNFIAKDLKLPKAHGIPDYSIETFYIH